MIAFKKSRKLKKKRSWKKVLKAYGKSAQKHFVKKAVQLAFLRKSLKFRAV